MVASILSRAAAIAMLSIPTGYAFQEIDNRDWQVIQEYSRSELLAYFESIRLPGHGIAIVLVFLAGCAFTACVEVIAWLLRRLFVRNPPPAEPSS